MIKGAAMGGGLGNKKAGWHRIQGANRFVERGDGGGFEMGVRIHDQFPHGLSWYRAIGKMGASVSLSLDESGDKLRGQSWGNTGVSGGSENAKSLIQ